MKFPRLNANQVTTRIHIRETHGCKCMSANVGDKPLLSAGQFHFCQIGAAEMDKEIYHIGGHKHCKGWGGPGTRGEQKRSCSLDEEVEKNRHPKNKKTNQQQCGTKMKQEVATRQS